MAGYQQRFAEEWMRRGLWNDETIGQALQRTASLRPEKVAVVDGDDRLTFGALFERAAGLARALGELGVRPGDTVAYQLPNWTEAIVASHAIHLLGAVSNPVLASYGARETEFILRQSKARLLFTPGTYRGRDHRSMIESLRPTLPDLARVVIVRDDPGPAMLDFSTLASTRANGDRRGGSDANAVALLIYTSGTTSDPKGVLHTHNTLLAEVRSLESAHALSAADTALMPSPLTHISGIVHAILVPAVFGATAVLMERWEATRARALVEREAVTYMVGAPVFAQDLCAAGSSPLETLRLFSCGGADVSPELIDRIESRLGCVAKRVYGSTEFPTVTTTGPGDPPERRRTTEGRALAGVSVRIVDDDGAECRTGEEGEILARGPECFIGYRDPSHDAEAFDEQGWFRTGDLGVLDADGYLRITGRKKDIIIRKGENISAREIEEHLAQHPSIAEVAVIGVPDPETGERACALVRLVSDVAPSLGELSQFLRDRGLSTRKLPERLEVVRSFPRTASGKIHKAALRRSVRPPSDR